MKVLLLIVLWLVMLVLCPLLAICIAFVLVLVGWLNQQRE